MQVQNGEETVTADLVSPLYIESPSEVRRVGMQRIEAWWCKAVMCQNLFLLLTAVRSAPGQEGGGNILEGCSGGAS